MFASSRRARLTGCWSSTRFTRNSRYNTLLNIYYNVSMKRFASYWMLWNILESFFIKIIILKYLPQGVVEWAQILDDYFLRPQGEICKRSKQTDCKSVPYMGSAGSNPSLTTSWKKESSLTFWWRHNSMRVIKYVASGINLLWSWTMQRGNHRKGRTTYGRPTFLHRKGLHGWTARVLSGKQTSYVSSVWRDRKGAVLICLREQFGWIGISKSRNKETTIICSI